MLRWITRDSLWRDLAIAVSLALLAAVAGARVELHEMLFDATRRWEHFELDEWPSALLVFALAMVALYARRHAQLRRALAENRRLVRRLIEVQEEERRRLARELHDELGQTLNAIKLDVLALPDAGAAQRIATSVDRVYGAAGDLVRSLRPPALDELGLSAALEACVDRWRRSHPGLAVQLSMAGELDELGETLSLALYRIVQEALTNCVRHARAGHFYIDLTRGAGAVGGVLLEMRDDGRGFDVATAGHTGSGLTGMRERVALLGGQFELLSAPGQGVTIRIEIPVREEEAWAKQ
ncbi:MAG TPA: sensor histidine kinase [Steroidobacteraceae bacterium]|nr:sensor histidine kinase [Steroidobacteraceae bacterium]